MLAAAATGGLGLREIAAVYGLIGVCRLVGLLVWVFELLKEFCTDVHVVPQRHFAGKFKTVSHHMAGP